MTHDDVARWQASLPVLEAQPTMDWPEMPDYAAATYDYASHSGADMARWWADGGDDDHAAINHILSVQRERFARDHHQMVFGAPPLC